MVGGLQPLTMIDFPGRIASVIFMQGCNLRCHYCHNPSLLPQRGTPDSIPWEEVISFLQKRRGFVEGVVFSGGEPTLQDALLDAVLEVHHLELEVAVQTNGSRPEILRRLIKQGGLGFVAMDFKAPDHKWGIVTQAPSLAGKFQESLDVLLAGAVPFEIRTTVHSSLLSERDLLDMAEFLAARRVKRWILQPFRTGKTLKPDLPPDHGALLRPAFMPRLNNILESVVLRSGNSERTSAKVSVRA